MVHARFVVLIPPGVISLDIEGTMIFPLTCEPSWNYTIILFALAVILPNYQPGFIKLHSGEQHDNTVLVRWCSLGF